jgi:hypothetical protein
MAERARDFRSPTEVEAARPKLDRACSVPLTEFASLVGHYYFKRDKWVRCQLEPKDGAVCRQEHGDGWIAKRKDGAEGYIGGDCAQRYFGADRAFATEAGRVRRELRIDDLIDRLNTKLSDRAFRLRAVSAMARNHLVRDEVTSAREAWPLSLLLRLHEMVKTGARAVDVEFRYVEREKDGTEHVQWQPVTIGSVVAAEGLDSIHMRRLAERLADVVRTLEEAQPSREHSERTLRKWQLTLEDLDQCEGELDEVVAALAAFYDPENLRLLCWLVQKDTDRRAIVRAIMEREGTSRLSDSAVQARLNAWAQEIRAVNQGREFRVP